MRQPLLDVIGAYVAYRPDFGYASGLSHLAAVFLLNMGSPEEAFQCLANLLNRQLLRAFYHAEGELMDTYLSVYDRLLQTNLPNLHSYLMKLGVTPDMYLSDWFLALFTKQVQNIVYVLLTEKLPLETAVRIWDLYLFSGEPFIFRATIGFMRILRPALLQSDFTQCVQLLKRATTSIPWEELYSNIRVCNFLVKCNYCTGNS